jgi:DNA-binding response OmpR family regulator
MTIAVESESKLSANSTTSHCGIVAIVDDDKQISRALGLWLELQGLRAVHHTSGESLLESIQHCNGVPTLHFGFASPIVMPLVGVILDLNLPGINGIELAKTLRYQSFALPIVVITALREAERVRYGAPPIGVRCLQKPFDLDALEDALFPLLH